MPDYLEKLKNKNLNEEEAGKITLRVINFIYSVVNENDNRLTPKDKEIKYEFLEQNYNFFKKSLGMEL